MSALIERLAVSPEADPEKLDRLLSYQERAYRDKARAAFGAAYTNLQLALPVLAENGEIRDRSGRVQYTYALWEDINEVIKPILSEHGFSLRFKIENADRQVSVTGELSHLGGHAETSTLKLPVDLSGGKNPVQAIGSSTSYGKRYVASALLNLTSRGEDDDGAFGPEQAKIDQEQTEAILDLLEKRGVTKATCSTISTFNGCKTFPPLVSIVPSRRSNSGGRRHECVGHPEHSGVVQAPVGTSHGISRRRYRRAHQNGLLHVAQTTWLSWFRSGSPVAPERALPAPRCSGESIMRRRRGELTGSVRGAELSWSVTSLTQPSRWPARVRTVL
jgi:hypothetical protein